MNRKPKYPQSKLSIAARVEDLPKRMTLEEKVAQLWAVFKESVADHCQQDDGDFSPEKAGQVFTHGLGRISAIFHTFTARRSAETANAIQKYALTHTRLGIPVLIDAEALHGCMCLGSTSHPQAIGLAATWNPDLVKRIAVAAGRESRARGIHQVLSPVCDIARDARAGRTEETYGEDPLLVS